MTKLRITDAEATYGDRVVYATTPMTMMDAHGGASIAGVKSTPKPHNWCAKGDSDEYTTKKA